MLCSGSRFANKTAITHRTQSVVWNGVRSHGTLTPEIYWDFMKFKSQIWGRWSLGFGICVSWTGKVCKNIRESLKGDYLRYSVTFACFHLNCSLCSLRFMAQSGVLWNWKFCILFCNWKEKITRITHLILQNQQLPTAYVTRNPGSHSPNFPTSKDNFPSQVPHQ